MFGSSGQALEKDFIGTGASSSISSCEHAFLMALRNPSFKAIFTSWKGWPSYQDPISAIDYDVWSIRYSPSLGLRHCIWSTDWRNGEGSICQMWRANQN